MKENVNNRFNHSDSRNHSNSSESKKSMKKLNFFLKGISHRFFHKNKTIGKQKSIGEQGILKKSNNLKKNKLFKDIILKCLQNLDLKSLGNAKQTCKEWKSLIETNEQLIWRQLCKRYWGLDHKKYANNLSHCIYEVQWKELFLLNYNMHHEKYYFTTHHQPFQLGEIQKKKRFSQTYLNINPYAFANSVISQSSSYYPFPYPKISSNEATLSQKKNIDTIPSNNIISPVDSLSSYSSVDNNNKNKNNDYPTASSTSLTDLPSSPETSKLLDQTLEENMETIDDSTSLYNLIEDDDYYNYSSSSSSSSSSSPPPPPPHNSNFSSYFSKVSLLNKFSNVLGYNQEKKSKKNYLMVWPYGLSEPYTVTICNHYLFWIFNFREIQVYDINTRKNVCRLKGHDGEIGLVLSNHQHYIVSFDLNSLVIIWDIRNFSIKRKINVKDSLGLIISMSVHRDRMVATNSKGLIMVWNINTGELITSYKIPKEFINPNEEENFTNVALWNDYIAFALQSSIYFIYDISKNKCVNIMYHPQNQRAQEMFHLFRQRLNVASTTSGNVFNDQSDDEHENIDNDSSNIDQILAIINQRSSSIEEDDEYQNYLYPPQNQPVSHQLHPLLEEETQEMMMPNPNNSTSTDPLTEEEDEEGEFQRMEEGNINEDISLPPQIEDENENNEEDLEDIIARQSQYPFTLAINSHLLMTNGPKRNKLSIWSLETGKLLYNLSEARALEKLDLHLPTLRMDDLFCELNFAEFSTDYSFIYTTIQYEQESSLAVWDFRSDQNPQKSRYFDIIDLNIDEQQRKFWIAYEYENEEVDES
ncbi:WD40 repeat-like protein [Piromyces finnis]|uniref:WD40 repeat-like protein n=1 Tax=Piromyces finnis TaxID=1754191 RepID=A0A1Y1V975_9FUNG|nr:WD40 repeat-like protein [Piromyces finnis]|eukprot:ORX50338.1 WD40 repeat-like protein [Piromyces finnis]